MSTAEIPGETPDDTLNRMLRTLPLSASGRRIRLLAAAVVRALQEHPENAHATRFDDLIEEWADAPRVYDEDFIAEVRHTRPGESWRFGHILRDDPPYRLMMEVRKYFALYPGLTAAEGVELIRDVMASVLRPVAFDSSWRSEAAVGLARGMYEGRDFTPMPALADALEAAGCADADVLAHCRGPGPHVRGCWVVDLVLGKT